MQLSPLTRLLRHLRDPVAWTASVLLFTQKKGDKTWCANCRDISLMGIAAKLFASVLPNRYFTVRAHELALFNVPFVELKNGDTNSSNPSQPASSTSVQLRLRWQTATASEQWYAGNVCQTVRSLLLVNTSKRQLRRSWISRIHPILFFVRVASCHGFCSTTLWTG